jgi:hypothetical protein
MTFLRDRKRHDRWPQGRSADTVIDGGTKGRTFRMGHSQ